MPEYRDGSFGPIKPITEAVQDLLEPANLVKTKVLHVGAFEELVQRAQMLKPSDEAEPLAKILQLEVGRLRRQMNRVLIKLGLDDKTEVLEV